ncbi:MAG: hypothetical protein Q4G04_05635 [bacterium]|nr:hypothetical protein [bacterium]
MASDTVVQNFNIYDSLQNKFYAKILVAIIDYMNIVGENGPFPANINSYDAMKNVMFENYQLLSLAMQESAKKKIDDMLKKTPTDDAFLNDYFLDLSKLLLEIIACFKKNDELCLKYSGRISSINKKFLEDIEKKFGFVCSSLQDMENAKNSKNESIKLRDEVLKITDEIKDLQAKFYNKNAIFDDALTMSSSLPSSKGECDELKTQLTEKEKYYQLVLATWDTMKNISSEDTATNYLVKAILAYAAVVESRSKYLVALFRALVNKKNDSSSKEERIALSNYFGKVLDEINRPLDELLTNEESLNKISDVEERARVKRIFGSVKENNFSELLNLYRELENIRKQLDKMFENLNNKNGELERVDSIVKMDDVKSDEICKHFRDIFGVEIGSVESAIPVINQVSGQDAKIPVLPKELRDVLCMPKNVNSKDTKNEDIPLRAGDDVKKTPVLLKKDEDIKSSAELSASKLISVASNALNKDDEVISNKVEKPVLLTPFISNNNLSVVPVVNKENSNDIELQKTDKDSLPNDTSVKEKDVVDTKSNDGGLFTRMFEVAKPPVLQESADSLKVDNEVSSIKPLNKSEATSSIGVQPTLKSGPLLDGENKDDNKQVNVESVKPINNIPANAMKVINRESSSPDIVNLTSSSRFKEAVKKQLEAVRKQAGVINNKQVGSLSSSNSLPGGSPKINDVVTPSVGENLGASRTLTPPATNTSWAA